MSEALLTLLRWCLLALIYLFFFRVLQATWFSTVAGRRVGAKSAASAGQEQATQPRRGPRLRSGGGAQKRPPVPTLTIVEPVAAAGASYPVTATLSIGRAAGCEITLDDTFISQIHARVSRSQSGVVVEDLGSTNGTYLNRKKVTAPVVVQPGDVIQVGSTVLELR